MQDMHVFSGNSNLPLARAICKHLGRELGKASVDVFPDGESHVQIGENVRGSDVFVIQSTSAPANHHLIELLIMVDALKRASAQSITAVIPFFGYARQDRKDQPRVPITAKLVADLLETAGVHRVLTTDLHAGQIQGFFGIPVDNLTSTPVFYQYFQKKTDNKNLIILSPDVGGIKMARDFSRRFPGSFLGVIDKNRHDANSIESMRIIGGDVTGKDAIIIDDQVSTAGTLVEAASLIKAMGAKSIRGAVTHAILSGKAVERITHSPIDELVVTDTIDTAPEKIKAARLKVLSMAPLFARAIDCIVNHTSISELFRIPENGIND